MPGLRSISQPLYVAATILIASFVACGGVPEEDILKRYFRAIRAGDNLTLSNIATATLDSGVVQDFTVTSVGESQEKEIQVKARLADLQEAETSQEAFNEEMKAYQDENVEAIGRILTAERSGEEVDRDDEEIQTAWAEWRENSSAQSKAVSDAGQALSNERATAEQSVFNASNPIDISQYDGKVVSKTVNITANVLGDDGSISEQNLTVDITRTELTGADGDNVSGRWIIAGIGAS